MKKMLLFLVVCAAPQASFGGEKPGDALLKSLAQIEFTTLKDRFQVEKAEYDAKAASFVWTLKSKQAAPSDPDGLVQWVIPLTTCQMNFEAYGKSGSAPRLRFFNDAESVGDTLHPDVKLIKGGKDGHLRLELRVVLSENVRSSANRATYGQSTDSPRVEAKAPTEPKRTPSPGAEFVATIVKVDGNNVTFKKTLSDRRVTLEVANDATVASYHFNVDKETKKGIYTVADSVAGGLKADVFASATETRGLRARITTSEDAGQGKITQILVSQFDAAYRAKASSTKPPERTKPTPTPALEGAGETGIASPKVWESAKIAKLKLSIGKQHESKANLDLPRRDFVKAAKTTLDATLASFRSSDFDFPKLYEAKVTARGDTLDVVLHLFADQEPAWLKDGESLKQECWGFRTTGGPIGTGAPALFNLSLEGKRQADGSFKGTVTGALQLRASGEGWIMFENADFTITPYAYSKR